jgi:hypothetical protein
LGGTPNINRKKNEKMKKICCPYIDTQEGEGHTNIKVIHKVTQLGGRTTNFNIIGHQMHN